jgi:hypothetical protein
MSFGYNHKLMYKRSCGVVRVIQIFRTIMGLFINRFKSWRDR